MTAFPGIELWLGKAGAQRAGQPADLLAVLDGNFIELDSISLGGPGVTTAEIGRIWSYFVVKTWYAGRVGVALPPLPVPVASSAPLAFLAAGFRSINPGIRARTDAPLSCWVRLEPVASRSPIAFAIASAGTEYSTWLLRTRLNFANAGPMVSASPPLVDSKRSP